MVDDRITLLNRAAREVYQPTTTATQQEASQTFERLSETPENLSLILEFLEHGEKPYAEFLASTSLKKLSERRITIPIDEQLRLSSQLLHFLASRANSTNRFAINKLVDVFANICKYNFTFRDSVNKNYPFRTAITDVQNATESIDSQGALAFEILTAVVSAFDEQKPGEGTTEHRVAHNEFQNKFLREFNNVAVTQLVQVTELLKKNNNAQPPWDYVKALLEFYKRILEYEFLGSHFEMEEREMVDMPTSWRQKTVEAYVPIFELYRYVPVQQSSLLKLIIMIGGSLASVRRTLFDSEERGKVIYSLLEGISTVLSGLDKLGTPEIFVEFSRFLFRMMRNFTFTDVAKHKVFCNDLLPVLSHFTVQAFEAFDSTASNGIFFLLAFWQRLTIHAVNPSKDEDMKNPLDSIKPVPIAFVQSRMKLCYLSSVGEIDSPFDDQVSISQFMDYFAGLCRIDVNGMSELLKMIFEENTQILAMNEPGSQQYLLAELKLIYWTYIVGSCLDNRETARCPLAASEEPEAFDVALFMNVTALSKFNTNRMQQLQNPYEVPSNMVELESAILAAFDRFRLTYLNETNRYFQEIQQRMAEAMGRAAEGTDALWELYLEKIATNVRVWSTIDDIITRTLALFSAVTCSTAVSRRVLNLQTVQFMIANHNANTFPFLASTNKSIFCNRTQFYSSLMRIVINGLENNDALFDNFMKDIQDRTDNIEQALNQHQVDENNLKMAIAGLARDYRGLGDACARLSSYSLLAGYCQNKIYPLFLKTMQRYYDDPIVVVSILKCLAELCQNRNARLAFAINNFRSCAVFMETAKIVQECCHRFSQLPPLSPSDKNFYSHRLKIVSALMMIVRNILTGNYLPLGIFYSYGDHTFKNMLNSVFGIFSQYASYAEDFPKIYNIYFETIYELARVYPVYVTNMNTNDLRVLFHYLELGFLANERSKLMNSCTAFERITDLILENNTRKTQLENVHCEPSGDAIKLCFEQYPKILESYFVHFVNMLTTDTRPVHYMVGRIIFNIVHLCPQLFPKWRDQFCVRHDMDIQERLNELFKDLFNAPFSNNDREIFTIRIEQFQSDSQKFIDNCFDPYVEGLKDVWKDALFQMKVGQQNDAAQKMYGNGMDQ